MDDFLSPMRSTPSKKASRCGRSPETTTSRRTLEPPWYPSWLPENFNIQGHTEEVVHLKQTRTGFLNAS